MRLATPLSIVLSIFLSFSLGLYTLQAYALQVETVVVAGHTSTTTIRLVRVDGEG